MAHLPTLKLLIDGKNVLPEDMANRCTFRFVSNGDNTASPVLYVDGKRETRLWFLHVQHEEPKDTNGRSG
jgi:hypothetical protein